MGPKGKNTKTYCTDFCIKNGGITSDESIEVKHNIPKDKLTIFDRQFKDHQYQACNGCIAYVEKTCTDCKRREIGVQTSYETISDWLPKGISANRYKR